MTEAFAGAPPLGETPEHETTTIGIVGLDYCGSTLMNNILSGLPDCIGAGETHWIIDSKKNPNQRGRCTECYNQECPVFSEELLNTMQTMKIEPNGEWWDIISKFSNCRFVISGDKRPRHYDKFGIPDKLLFMLKDPRAHIVSWAKRKYLQPNQNLKQYNQGNTNLELNDEQFNEAFTTWLRETRKHITWCIESKKDLAVVSLEHFVVNDEYMLAQIADWMGADFDAKALEYWNTDLHYIGSNHSVKRIKQDRYFFKEVKKDRRWEDVLTIEQSNFVKNHEKVHYQFNRLKPYLIGELEPLN